MKTYMAKKENIEREWFVVDAKGKVLGRLASRIAGILQGKHKVNFTPHVDCGDGVIVINAKKIRVSGKKMEQKIYTKYSGYPGGLKQMKMSTLFEKNPRQIIRIAVKKMLPKNKLGRRMIKRLKIYTEEAHPHKAQEPKGIDL
jgi:large subunit ribosomal protein L13